MWTNSLKTSSPWLAKSPTYISAFAGNTLLLSCQRYVSLPGAETHYCPSVCLRNLFPCFLRAEIIVRLQHDNMTAIQTIGVFSFEIIFSFLGYFRVEPQPVEGRLVHRVHLPRVGEPYWVGLSLVVDFSHSWRGPVPGLSSQRLLSPGTNIEPPRHYNW